MLNSFSSMHVLKSGRQRSGCHNDLASACFVSIVKVPSSAVCGSKVLLLKINICHHYSWSCCFSQLWVIFQAFMQLNSLRAVNYNSLYNVFLMFFADQNCTTNFDCFIFLIWSITIVENFSIFQFPIDSDFQLQLGQVIFDKYKKPPDWGRIWTHDIEVCYQLY